MRLIGTPVPPGVYACMHVRVCVCVWCVFKKITSQPRNCLHVYDDTPGVNGNYSEFSRPASLKNFCHFFFPLPCQFDLKMKAALFDFDVSSLGRNSTPECTMKTFVQFSQSSWNVVWTGRVQPLPKSLNKNILTGFSEHHSYRVELNNCTTATGGTCIPSFVLLFALCLMFVVVIVVCL